MPYRRKRKNKIEWIAEVMRQGKRFYKVCATKKEALDWESETRSKPLEDLETPLVCLTLLEWATQYLEFSNTRYADRVFREKKAAFRVFFQSVDSSLTVNQLKPGMVLKHLQVQAKKRSGYAANKERKNLMAAWNWGMKYLGLPSPNPCMVERFPEERHARYIPPEEDFWKVYETTEGQDQVMLLACLHLAARRSELFRLKWDDIDFANQRVRIGTRKRQGGSLEYDYLPMTEDLYNALLEHKELAHDEWVFVDTLTSKPFSARRRFMRGLCERAEVKPFGFHAIRHLTASILAQADVPMITIQRILRHKNLMTTERYVRGLEPVRPALEILSGRHLRPQSRPVAIGH